MSQDEPRSAPEPGAEDPAAPDAQGPTPRERVAEHLEKLLRGATAVGAGMVLSWAGRADAQRPPQVCDPLPPPVNCKAPDDFSVGRCAAQQTRWSRLKGVWGVDCTIWLLKVSRNPWEVFPALSAPPPPAMLAPGEPAQSVTFARVRPRDLKVTGGAAESVTAASNRIDIRLRPGRGAKSVSVTLPDPADAGKPFTVVLDVSQAPAEGQVVPVRLVEERR